MHNLGYTLLRDAIQFRNVCDLFARFISSADVLIAAVLRWNEIRARSDGLRLTNI
jgi:hypothetical protein